MFYVFDREEIKPYIVPDTVGAEEVDVIETNLMNFDGGGLPDFWRVTGKGDATLIRPYREDAPVKRVEQTHAPGTWFSPRLLVQDLTEFTAHATAMLDAFLDASAVEFRCSWYGLTNRSINDFNLGVIWDRRISRADSRTTAAKVERKALIDNWPALVATLAKPTAVLFDGLDINEEWVKHIAPEFRKP
jgi:hypothetical protein